MPFYLVHAGTALYKVDVVGNATAISLPSGVTMVSSRPARFAILNREIVVANATSANIVVSATDLSTRLLSITGPASAPSVAAGSSGVLTGDYRYKVTFLILSGSTVLTESPFSAVAGPVTVASQQVDLTSIPTSGTTGVNARRVYRTTNGGTDYFLVTTISDNSTTTYSDNTSDYDLALLPSADDLGNPPGVDSTDRFRLLVSWKDRLWGSPNNNPDRVYWSENRKLWGWSATNFLTVKPIGADAIGVTAFMVRRDDLLVGKKRALWMIRGVPPDTIQDIQIFEGPGPLSQESALVIHDTGYYLGEDGVYEVSGTGVTRISEEQVHPWFTTDTYFNRALFSSAFARWNPASNTYELHLAAAGSTTIDRWVSFDLRRRLWLGPHKTDAFTPSMASLMENSTGQLVTVIGSSAGNLYEESATGFNDDSTAVALSVRTKFFGMNTPDIMKFFGELSMISRVQSAGTLTITPTVGGLDASAASVISHDMTLGRQRLRRLGTGRFAQLLFTNSESDQDVEIYGFELPYHELGRR